MARVWREQDHPRDPEGQFADKSGWAGQLLKLMVGGRSAEPSIAERLNSGKRLNLSDPDEKQLYDLIGAWTAGGREGSRLQREMQDATLAPDADTDGARFMRVVAAAPANAPTLHRGYHVLSRRDVPHEGQVLDLAPTSFSRDYRVAEAFSIRDIGPLGRIVLIRLKKNSRSLNIGKHSKLDDEAEWISMGRYRVTGRRDGSIKIDLGGSARLRGRTYPIHEIDIEQIEMS